MQQNEDLSIKYLPYNTYLDLDKTDLFTIRNELLNVIDIQALKSIRMLYNTNMCESLNALVFSHAPKSINWGRNFAGLCHSAVHSRKLGRGNATMALATEAGISVVKNSYMYVLLKKQDKRRMFHAKRKATQAYKQSRYFLRKRQSNRALFQNSLYSRDEGPSTSSIEHSYGLSH